MGFLLPSPASHPLMVCFFFNDTATTEIYTLSLHDALPISLGSDASSMTVPADPSQSLTHPRARSEEHTSELQSQSNLVCRLLLEKKKKPSATDSLPRPDRRRPPRGVVH